ncbi:hypothetical protein [Kitasatospora sp. CB01950]|uniref:hypothetical protein n=1 Tax=Kitasatospora sp. CB01950 TaxID=1703930 RepID=UPI00093E13A3|nr:hypothetical protein [Kitasatospora sp. CB01950]OKJ13837.1 hypothetical protein AMK19_10610 [Kitasatospora sp. CB01950]
MGEFTGEPTRRMFLLLEHVMAADGDESNAVAVGFLDTLLNAWTKGFDLEAAWRSVGPASRARCRAWNAAMGVQTPAWMREVPPPRRAARLAAALRWTPTR